MAWLLVEVASVVRPTFEAPGRVMKVVTFLAILGFPLALVLAWAFELTPEGIKREAIVEPAESESTRWKTLSQLGGMALCQRSGVVLCHLGGIVLCRSEPAPL